MTERRDYVVVGSGLAGLTFALHAAEHGRVCVLTKNVITESNTNYAQGGIAAAVGESDSWELHEQDTLTAGAGLCDREAVRFLVQQAPGSIRWLQQLGARFDLDEVKQLDLGREGGHSMKRIVHYEDRTGWEVERAVTEAVRRHPNIEVFENAFAVRLIMHEGRCGGVEASLADIGVRHFLGRAVLIATGGCGKIYAHTTNPRIATADGIGLADEAGARIENMEFMQFHPTTLSHPQMGGFLITEAIRGAGGILRNHNGRRFMYDYDERLELAPRDVVARAIERELARLDTWCVYLDTTHMDPQKLEHEFPTIWQRLRTVNIEMEKDWIPVVPAQHYSCGGIRTDLQGRTNIPGLYASGEVSCTGVHGANRLASNSLLEAMVFSEAAAKSAQTEPEIPSLQPDFADIACPAESEAIRIRHALQRLMSHKAGIFRTTKGLQDARREIAALERDYQDHRTSTFSVYAFEARSLLAAARLVVTQALERSENVGLHYNIDLESGASQ